MEGFYDDKENVYADILLGRKELKKLQFDYECGEEQELLYELYCIPSHNEYAYYVQIFRKADSFYLSYARPEIEDFVIGETIYMYTLQDAEVAKEKNRYYGKIVCGYKKVSTEFLDYLNMLCNYLPEGSHWKEEESFCLDGTFQMIRFYSEGKIKKEVAFNNELKSIADKDAREKLSILNQFVEKEIKG